MLWQQSNDAASAKQHNNKTEWKGMTMPKSSQRLLFFVYLAMLKEAPTKKQATNKISTKKKNKQLIHGWT